MNSGFRKTVGVVSGLCLLSGCVVLRDTETKWEEGRKPLEFEGPGAQDATLHRYENNKFEQDSGRRIAIGLFPGFGKAWDDGAIGSYIAAEIVGVPIFGIPFWATIPSLFCAPFCETECSLLGLIGCHRWQSKVVKGRSLVKAGEKEDIIEIAEDSQRRECMDGLNGVAPVRLTDGMKLRYLYLGFHDICSDIETNGQVAVMFERGPRAYRKFKKSKCVDGALTYEDVEEGVDAAADQLIWRRRLEIATNDIAMIESSKELSLCGESYSNQVFEIEKEVADRLKAGDFVGDFVFAKQDAISSLQELIKRESEIVAKIKQLKGLMAQKEYGDVLAAKSDSDADERLLAVYEEAASLQEEERICLKLKDVKGAYDRNEYQDVLYRIAGESDRRFKEMEQLAKDALIRQEDARIAELKRKEEEERREIEYADAHATKNKDGKLTSMNPKSKWYRGPDGIGFTNDEIREQLEEMKKEGMARAKEGMKRKEEFVEKAKELYYSFHSVNYNKNGELLSLLVFRNGNSGFMKASITGFSYPAWMSESEAETIWNVFETDWESSYEAWRRKDPLKYELWGKDGKPVSIDNWNNQ